MIKNQIKSVLRNKSNKIYIITFIILFLILNISLNIVKIIDNYYDLKMKEIINGSDAEEKYSRTIYTTTGITFEEQEKEEIMKLKYVKDIEVEIRKTKIGIIDEETGKTEFVDTEIIINYIILDNWKHCTYIQNYFDSKGIETSILLTQLEIYENYNIVKTFSNVISYVLIAIFLLVLMACYKNILRNEEENIKLLKLTGYISRQTRNILFTSVIILVTIGWIIGGGIFKILIYLLDVSINENIIVNLGIKVILTIMPLFIIIQDKVRKI